MFKYFYFILLCISIAFPISSSRIITTFDYPGEYSVPIYNSLNNELISKNYFETDFSIDIAYEHLVLDGNDFLFLIGGEFMIGRKSSSNVAFHSIYLMPMLKLLDKTSVFLKGGFSFLNTQQENFFLDKGLMLSAGIEYSISKNISMAISATGYDLFNETYITPDYTSIPFIQLGLDPQLQIPDIDIDMKYTKFGISVIYGF